MNSLWEIVTFVRAHLERTTSNILANYAVAQTRLFLLAPLRLISFVYMTSARMTQFLLTEKRVWSLKAWGMRKWFVWAGGLSFIIQANGGNLTVPGRSSSTVHIGLSIYMGGVTMMDS